MPSFTYIIEHMEEDDESDIAIPPWVRLEYMHMRSLAGSEAELLFTHLSPKSRESLTSVFIESSAPNSCSTACFSSGVMDLMKEKLGDAHHKICLLDPKAEKELSSEDGDGRFQWFLFGGILGDDPPRDRTSELRMLGFPSRHLGSVQMTTDTALGVTKLIVEDKTEMSQIRFVDFPTIRFNLKESVEMPFRYICEGENSQPLLPPGMRELLHEDLNKSFDF